MKKILGLDLGTNSIGWAVVNAETETQMVENKYQNEEKTYLKPIGISSAGSRIIPMSADILGDFEKGNSISQTADRTKSRMARRIRERNLLRRERLLRVLKKIGFLPEHFANQINEYGKFINYDEPKLAWKKNSEGKSEFLFQQSFDEMLEDFKKNQPELVSVRENGKQRKVPYDWTIYYLRKKALTQRISKEELAWILLQFNQKRGYYQLRGEEEEVDNTKLVEYLEQEVVRVEATDEKKGEDVWYNVYLKNGMIYRRTSRIPLDWEGKVKGFIVTTDLEKDGTPKKDKDGNIKRSFRAPKEDDWTLLKKKTEYDIDNSHKTVGCYIYDALLQNPNQKIIGKLVRTVERKYYKEELTQILESQKEFIPELQDDGLYNSCINLLYPNNESHRNNIVKSSFTYLFINDILFYQRPLKSKKFLISNCSYESRIFIDKNTGKKKSSPIKCIAKSNPLFQEFRLWQFVQNLRIYQREKEIDNKLLTDVDVTNEKLETEDDYVKLFEWLNDKATIKQDTLLNFYFKKEKNKDQNPYRWNYVEEKEYPCNETRAEILKGLDKCGIPHNFLTKEREMKLWHILYSVEDKTEIGKALKKFAGKNGLPESFAEVFVKIKPFKKEYGAFSEKAIKKLLPLMRMGKYWSADTIDAKTKERIDKIITGEYDESISTRTREKIEDYKKSSGRILYDISTFKCIPNWLACYIVYNRHSETKDIDKWEKPEDIDNYLKHFKQHSMRNPIVEQVITETLRTVRDIWKQEGQIDEIHIELGRCMKNTSEDRAKRTLQNIENEQSNLRIKALLMEFLNSEYEIENVRPYSPSQHDLLKIYEENALGITYKVTRNKETKTSKIEVKYASDVPEDIISIVTKLNKREQPTKSEFMRYKLWLEQKYRSPYTGEMIPLAKLFTSAYEIEHVIPQSRYFDDSFSNKVICEAEVNKLKDRQLGYEFIKNHKGQKVQISQGKTVEIFSEEDYEKFVKAHYSNNRTKMKKLLMDDIPDGFIERQLNDSRYISKFIKGLLSNIVREELQNGEYEPEAVSKNLISCNGSVTDRLKKDWGINDVWNNIILPRFKRMNELTQKISDEDLLNEFHRLFESELTVLSTSRNETIKSSFIEYFKSLDNDSKKEVTDNIMKQLPITESFLTVNSEGHLIPNMPLELQKGFNKKRIDHRHHAMDAIVIACATRSHVQYLNNESAKTENRKLQKGLAKQLCTFKEVEFKKKTKDANGIWVDSEVKTKAEVPDKIKKPWNSFTADTQHVLENIIVSFKQNLRVINKSSNHYESYKDEDGKLRIGEDGKPKKKYIKQGKGDNWAIRKSMHKDTGWGEVNLRFTKDVSLNEALRNPKAIVNKDFKQKVQELLAQGHDAKYIKKYVEGNKDVWSDIDINGIRVYYYTQDVKDENGIVKERHFATRFMSDLVGYMSGIKEYNKAIDKIEKITDTGIQKILKAHLQAKNNNPELAFSADGIDEMNRNILELNDGKPHKSIYKVRRYEKGNKFSIGQNGCKAKKFVEADDGTNLFFVVYQTSDKGRTYATISFELSVECQKDCPKGKNWLDLLDERLRDKSQSEGLKKYQRFEIPKDANLLFVLAVNDLVYLPSESEIKNGIEKIDTNRIYKTVSFNKKQCFCIRYEVAKPIVNKVEFTSSNKAESAITGEMIKETCIPLKIDRIGNIIEFNNKQL